MDKFDQYQVKFDIRFFKFIGYVIWLLGEIAKSNIQVIKTILQGDKNINQKMFYKYLNISSYFRNMNNNLISN